MNYTQVKYRTDDTLKMSFEDVQSKHNVFKEYTLPEFKDLFSDFELDENSNPSFKNEQHFCNFLNDVKKSHDKKHINILQGWLHELSDYYYSGDLNHLQGETIKEYLNNGSYGTTTERNNVINKAIEHTNAHICADVKSELQAKINNIRFYCYNSIEIINNYYDNFCESLKDIKNEEYNF